MREIKFRAWQIKGERMLFPSYISFGKDGVFSAELHSLNSVWKESINNFVLMQYTGLKDRKGKEIYEGDIVAHMMRDVYKSQPGFQKKEVVSFKDGYFLPFGSQDDEFCAIPGVMEIIGNIYENPELLKV